MGIRHKYEKVEGKLWEVLKQFEEGAEFYQYNPDINEVKPMFSRIESINILMANLIDLGVYRKVEPPWYESVPYGGLLCWIKLFKSAELELGRVTQERVNKLMNKDQDSIDFLNGMRPLTRAEIQFFMDNAPEE